METKLSPITQRWRCDLRVNDMSKCKATQQYSSTIIFPAFTSAMFPTETYLSQQQVVQQLHQTLFESLSRSVHKNQAYRGNSGCSFQTHPSVFGEWWKSLFLMYQPYSWVERASLNCLSKFEKFLYKHICKSTLVHPIGRSHTQPEEILLSLCTPLFFLL